MTVLWNSFEELCIFLIVFLLVARPSARHVASLKAKVTVLCGSVLCLSVAALLAHGQSSISGKKNQAELSPAALLQRLSTEVPNVMRSSRPVLLGSRNPSGPSCVVPVHTGEVTTKIPDNPGDFDGGPGTRLATFYTFERSNFTNARQDYEWHQTRFRRFLANEATENAVPFRNAMRLAETAEKFMRAAESWSEVPAEVKSVGFTQHDDWPDYCLWSLDKAIANRDLTLTRHWATELASAALSMEDLHRWLDFLVNNHITALDFQARCKDLFDHVTAEEKDYQSTGIVSRLPAGMLGYNGFGNYYEIEREGERMFSMPPDRVAEIATDEHLSAGSVWVSPGVRQCFLKLQSALGEENQRTWDQAARTPFEHSFLLNILYRVSQSDSAEQEATVLRAFDALHPHASVTELMSVLMYRGHSFAGLEWSDRFQPALMQAAGELSGSDDQAILKAAQWTNRFYRTDGASYGVSFTLRDALQRHTLDCVRATDMIGAIYRDAGRVRFSHVRLCSETLGHSVAAVGTIQDGKRKVYLVDALAATPQLELWPDAYVHGHPWPPGMENNAPAYSAELYSRGLDNYIWSQGFIIRGPNAGTFVTSSIPYLPMHPAPSTSMVN